MKVDPSKLEIMVPDTRGVTLSPWGAGNMKLGPDVVTYSKLAVQTCPGASPWCTKYCYAKRISGLAEMVQEHNTIRGSSLPTVLPLGTDLVRIHVAGDFDSVEYILNWINLVAANPNVQFWAYTRSWTVPALLSALSSLQKFPNIELFASMDESMAMCNIPWRKAWIEGDPRIPAGMPICPEEQGKLPNCQACGYCFKRGKKDIVFLAH